MRILAVLTIYLLSTAAARRPAEASLNDPLFRENLTQALEVRHTAFRLIPHYCEYAGVPLESFTGPLDQYEEDRCDLLDCLSEAFFSLRRTGFFWYSFNSTRGFVRDNCLLHIESNSTITDDSFDYSIWDGICGGYKKLLANPEAECAIN